MSISFSYVNPNPTVKYAIDYTFTTSNSRFYAPGGSEVLGVIFTLDVPAPTISIIAGAFFEELEDYIKVPSKYLILSGSTGNSYSYYVFPKSNPSLIAALSSRSFYYDVSFGDVSFSAGHARLIYRYGWVPDPNELLVTAGSQTISNVLFINTPGDTTVVLYSPDFIGLQDINPEEEPIPFMYGYENSLFIDDGLIFEEYEITFEENDV